MRLRRADPRRPPAGAPGVKARYRPWPAADVEELRRLAPHMVASELAAHFKTSRASIRSKCQTAGIVLKLAKSHHCWTPAEVDTVRVLALTLTVREIAEHLGKTFEQIQGVRRGYVIKMTESHNPPPPRREDRTQFSGQQTKPGRIQPLPVGAGLMFLRLPSDDERQP